MTDEDLNSLQTRFSNSKDSEHLCEIIYVTVSIPFLVFPPLQKKSTDGVKHHTLTHSET